MRKISKFSIIIFLLFLTSIGQGALTCADIYKQSLSELKKYQSTVQSVFTSDLFLANGKEHVFEIKHKHLVNKFGNPELLLSGHFNKESGVLKFVIRTRKDNSTDLIDETIHAPSLFAMLMERT